MLGNLIRMLTMVLLSASVAVAAGETALPLKMLKPGAVLTVDRVLGEGKVLVSVTDAQKKPIMGLVPADFSLNQSGREATISSVQPFEENVDVPRHLVLVLDNSSSMEQRNAVQPLLAAVDGLLKIVRPIDQVSMVVFDDQKVQPMGGRDLHVRVFQSSDPVALSGFLKQAYSADGMTSRTVLFEGLLAGLDLIRRMPAEEPRFMVVFSDGEDLNSAFKADEVADAAKGLPPFGVYGIDYMPGERLDEFLKAFTSENQGQIWKAKEGTSLVPIFEEVASRMQYQYVVRYRFPPSGSLTVAPTSLTVEEIKTIDASPMLGHVYFAAGSSAIPDQYVRLAGPEQTGAFDEKQFRDTLEKYSQILNLVGKRMTEHPAAKIVLVGCNANTGAEKGNKKLSGERAEAVRNYLQTVWNIAPERMVTEARNLPEMPSTSRLEEGQADNRRVEIRSEDPAILDLVRSTYLATTIDSPGLTLRPVVDTAHGIARWKAVVANGAGSLEELSGEGPPAAETYIPLRLGSLKNLATAGPISVTMSLQDNKGQDLALTAAPLSVRFVETKERQAQKQDFRVQEKYALILFDFDSDAIGARNQAIVNEIVARIRELPDATVAIVGHTDNIGKDDYNLKLSARRAQAVYDLLEAGFGQGAESRFSHTGVGAADPLYNNLSPEARAFNRTVTITLEYLAKE